MKNGWRSTKLRDVCRLINGRAYKKPELLPAGPYPVLRVGNFFTNNQWYYSDLELDADKYCDSGDLLYAWSASFGPRIWDGGKVIYHYHIWKVEPCADVIDKRFLYLWFLWDVEQIKADHGTGTTMIHVGKGSMEARDITVPPLAEQRRIVGILDEAFAGIATARANAEQNLQNARALFESHLNAVFERRSIEVPLSELATDITDGDHSPPPKVPSGVPFITISNIVKRTRAIDFGDTFYVPEDYFSNLKPNKKPTVGDVLYTVTGATLGIPVLVREQRNFCFQRHIGLIRPKPDVDSAWLSYALLSPQLFRQATIGSTGTAQKTVSLRVLRGLKVPKIGWTEQKRVASRLDALEAETQRLESIYQRKLAALDELKKSLLHQAFSGQLTASVGDESLAKAGV